MIFDDDYWLVSCGSDREQFVEQFDVYPGDPLRFAGTPQAGRLFKLLGSQTTHFHSAFGFTFTCIGNFGA